MLQTEEAQKEAWERMNPMVSLVSDQTSSLINGPVQDHVTGPVIMTDKRSLLSRDQFMQCIAQMPYYDFTEFKNLISRAEKFYSYPYRGKVLFSSLLPSNMRYKKKNDYGTFEVVDGIVIDGTADKSVIYDIIHQIKKGWGDKTAQDFINNNNYLVNWYLQAHYMFSIGLDDCLDMHPDPTIKGSGLFKNRKFILDKTTKAIRKAEIEVERINKDPLYNQFEKEIYTNNALNACMGDETTSAIHPDNGMGMAVRSGGKGKKFNLVQMRLFIGQQNIGGVRPKKTMSRGKRCNIYCPVDDDTPKYRGFVEESYVEGMSPLSFIFHCMGAREGIVNTSITTADTGYSQRRMVKKNENSHADENGVVRSSNDRIVEPIYGGDGLSARELIKISGFENPQFMDAAKILDMIDSEIHPSKPFETKVDECWPVLEEPTVLEDSEIKDSSKRMRKFKKSQIVALEEKMDKLTEIDEIYMHHWSSWWKLNCGADVENPIENSDGLPVLKKQLLYDYKKRMVTRAITAKGNFRELTEKEVRWCNKNNIRIL